MKLKTIHGVDPSGFLVGFDFDGEPIADAVAALLTMGLRPLRGATPQQQQTAPQQQQPFDDAPSPPTQPALVDEDEPDFYRMAVEATTAGAFDWVAFLALSPSYESTSQLTNTRKVIAPAWTPSEKTNRALLLALSVYHDKLGKAQARGEAFIAARQFAKREAKMAYNEALKG